MIPRNDLCPCGSGKKYKKCCLSRGGPDIGFTQEHRFSSFAKLRIFAEEYLDEDRQHAIEKFYGPMSGRLGELGQDATETSLAVCDVWFFLDYELPAGGLVVDRLLEAEGLSLGERRYLEEVRQTAMKLYEVVDSVPGVSVTFRDVLPPTSAGPTARAEKVTTRSRDFDRSESTPRIGCTEADRTCRAP